MDARHFEYARRPEIHHRLVGMPEELIPAGSTIHYELESVQQLDDGAVEMVMRYLDHD